MQDLGLAGERARLVRIAHRAGDMLEGIRVMMDEVLGAVAEAEDEEIHGGRITRKRGGDTPRG